jgi:hypothetical protein
VRRPTRKPGDKILITAKRIGKVIAPLEKPTCSQTMPVPGRDVRRIPLKRVRKLFDVAAIDGKPSLSFLDRLGNRACFRCEDRQRARYRLTCA